MLTCRSLPRPTRSTAVRMLSYPAHFLVEINKSCSSNRVEGRLFQQPVSVWRFSPVEDATIPAMDLSGATIAEIARKLGRPWNLLRCRLMTMFDQAVQPAARLGRAAAIERLVVVIADCQERDLRFILSAVLEDICAGEPAPDFSGVDQEAGNWGPPASDDELGAYFVACGVTASPEAGLARAARSDWPRERWRT